MKYALILCAVAMYAHAAQPVLVRVTAKTLADLQARDPMIRLVAPAEGEAKVVRPVNPTIIGHSTILHDGKNWTLVPKGALAFLPEILKSKVNTKPVGTLLPWTEFLSKNHDWITTCEVTFDEAAGNKEIPAGKAESWTKQGKAVITVHQGGPISVRLPDHNSVTQR